MAKAKVTREEKLEAIANAGPNIPAGKYTVTENIRLSVRIQKAGVPISDMTGGAVDDPKRHYFKTSIHNIKDICAGKKVVLTAEDLEQLSEVEKIQPTKFLDTGLESKVSKSGKPIE